jgi:mannose/fructose/N-acetylgalactosamine-specific phosphotransferase system component IIC
MGPLFLSAVLVGLLHLHRRALVLGLFAHPLVVGPAVGLVEGDVGIGIIVAVALSLWWERPGSGPNPASMGSGVGTAVGTIIGVHAADRGGMGGLLVESFSACLLALLVAPAAAWTEEALRRRVLGPPVGAEAVADGPRPLRVDPVDGTPWPLLRYHALDMGLIVTLVVLGSWTGALLLDAVLASGRESVARWSPWLSAVLVSSGLGAAIGTRHPRFTPIRPIPDLVAPTDGGPSPYPPGAVSAWVRSVLAEGGEGDPALARRAIAWALSAWPGRSRDTVVPPVHRALLPAVIGAAGYELHRGRSGAQPDFGRLDDAASFADGVFWGELRLAVVVGGLLSLNFLGPSACFAILLGGASLELLVRTWGFRQGAQRGPAAVAELLALPWARLAFACRTATLLAAIPIALFIVWLPYQLPSQVEPHFPVPWAGTVAVGPVAAYSFKMAPFLLGIAGARWPRPLLLAASWAALLGTGLLIAPL